MVSQDLEISTHANQCLMILVSYHRKRARDPLTTWLSLVIFKCDRPTIKRSSTRQILRFHILGTDNMQPTISGGQEWGVKGKGGEGH